MEFIGKEHPSFPGYLISRDGKIFSLRQGRNKLRATPLRAGYPFAALFKNGKAIQVHVHRLVAELYLPRVAGKNHVNHLNGDRTDNRIENLEWCTHQENRLHACRVLKKGIGSKNGKAVLTEESVLQIKKMLVKKISQKEIAYQFGVSRTTITAINTLATWGHITHVGG